MRQQAVTAAAGAAQQIGAAVQPCSRAARQLRRSRRGEVRRWRGRRQQWRGAALATVAAETAATGECHRLRARPPCCWTPTTRLALDQTISAGSANFFIEANTGRGSDRELLRFPELVRREPQDEPAPRPAASARGRCSGRSAPIAENRAGEEEGGAATQIVIACHTCLASLKKKKTTPSSTLHARPS